VTGITAFDLADEGFSDVTGIDLFLPECISVAENVGRMGGYSGVQFFVGDGFAPDVPATYDVRRRLHIYLPGPANAPSRSRDARPAKAWKW
jgi:hypothetical protein